MAQCLKLLHRENIIHCDLKPVSIGCRSVSWGFKFFLTEFSYYIFGDFVDFLILLLILSNLYSYDKSKKYLVILDCFAYLVKAGVFNFLTEFSYYIFGNFVDFFSNILSYFVTYTV